jgi:hypothetical protein
MAQYLRFLIATIIDTVNSRVLNLVKTSNAPDKLRKASADVSPLRARRLPSA